MAAANSNGCLADLRLDDPELRRQAIKSLFAEKTFISHSSMKPRSNNRFCRKWQRMSFGLGHRWMPKDMDRASLGMNRPSEACSIEGLGNDIRVATMSFADIARRSKEAEAQFLLQASKWQQGKSIKKEADDEILLSSDDEMVCLSAPGDFPVKSEIKAEVKKEGLDEVDSDLEPLATHARRTAYVPATISEGSGAGDLPSPDKSAHRQIPSAWETPQPSSKRSRPVASSAEKIMIFAESLAEAPAELRRLAKAGQGNVEVVHK
eukprot:TRINITY_DN11216_c0_g1_i3.p1 TRINITY_DN11216_c0_g1~~TRINITY_DN11216_c0_g1_i3.p1  ORF type:complete len:284 (-),score=49.42 TRINITY_DN11216_c0_g1_i3:250-1041(-)